MKHIKTFEKYQNKKRRDDIIRESVLQVNDIYKVRAMIDVPQSLINSYVKKVKDMTGKNIRQFFGDVDIAEEIVKFINLEFLNVDKIPGGFLTGDAQTQPQGQSQVQSEVGLDNQEEVAQPEGQVQVQADAQDNFEEVQDEPQPQAQPEGQTQAQPDVQGEGQDEGEYESEELPEEDENEEENEEF